MAGRREDGPLSLTSTGHFYAGGEVTADGRAIGQMFVEYSIPADITAPCPIVMIHGNYQNGSNFLGTPDDRQGWAEYFLRRGYPVYVVDQVARGRSQIAPEDGAANLPDAARVEQIFTAPALASLWPEATLHTQWPGSGVAGDPVFTQFLASQQPGMNDAVRMDVVNRRAGAALLRRIGRAILLTHSRSAAIGWAIADDVPDLVAGIIAVEPNGPPFYDVAPNAPATPVRIRDWGIAYDRLTYDPPAADAAALVPIQEATAQGPNLQPCWFLQEARRLPHLAGIPIMVLTAEASYHAPYDHCTAQFLTHAGVANDFIRLEDHGIQGNGHMLMLEKNNLEIADLIHDWIAAHIT